MWRSCDTKQFCRLKSWKAGDFPLRRRVTKQPRWPTLPEHVSSASTTDQRSRPAMKFEKKRESEREKASQEIGEGRIRGRRENWPKMCGFSGVSGTMCEEERLCSCRAPWRRAGRLRANALWKCPGGKGWIGGGAQASSWYRRFDSRAEGKKRIQTVVVKPSSGRPSANVRSTWWQPRLVRAAFIWDLVVRSRRTWFWGSTFDRWIGERDVSGVMGERRNREGQRTSLPQVWTSPWFQCVPPSFLSRSFGPSLSFCASACLFSLFSRCAFCPGLAHTHTHIHTQTCLYLFLTLSGRHHLFFEIEVIKVARARADPAEDWQHPRHWRSWCTRSGWNRGGTWFDGLFSRLMHKYRPKMAVARSQITLSFISRQS